MGIIKVREPETRETEKHPTRYYSKRQENSVAKAVGGNRTANSGAGISQKGDVLTEQFTIECKTKTSHSDSISIKKDWIQKQKEESAYMGKPYWTIVFNFGPDEENLYIVNEELFQELQEYLKQKED